MKRALLTLSCVGFAVVGLQAQTLFWYDTLNYPTGNITTNSSGAWINHSGSADTLVVAYPGGVAAQAGNRYEVSQARTGDIHRWFDPVNTNAVGSGTLYASFIVSVTNLPSNSGGTYFAHFSDAGTTSFGTQFRGRLFTIVPTNTFPYNNNVPGIFRFGVANAKGDAAFGTNGPTAVVPIDLALNTDYQVVLKYDIDNARCMIWVNPGTIEDETAANGSGWAFDIGAVANPLAAFCFRQATGEGNLVIRDLAVGQAFADVVTNTPAVPVIGLQPAGVTNFSGNAAVLEVAASGMGVLTYQWYKDGSVIPAGTYQTLQIASLSGSDEGLYYCAIGNSAGTTNSASAYLSVNTTPTPLTFTLQPVNTTNNIGQSATLTANAVGTGPISYQWKFNGAALSDGPSQIVGDTSVVSGSQTPVLQIANLSTNETGNYSVTVTGGAGSPITSTNAYLRVVAPTPVGIAYLRTLLDTTTWQTTDTTTMFTITGVITTFTNTTSGTTSSYYIQDNTGGINLFVTGAGATAFRPQMGDIVTATGTLLSYNNSLELQCLTSNPYQTYGVVGHTNLPAPFVFSPLLTNNPALMEQTIEGRFVMLTNVYFPSTGTQTFKSGNTIVTNQNGVPFIVYVGGQCTNVIGQPMPTFAYSVLGALTQYKSGSTYANSGYEVYLTTTDQLITTPPPAPTVAATLSANKVVLTWDAVPYNYSYTVLVADDVSGPYAPLAAGLSFTSAAGTYTDNIGSTGQKFYKIVSP